MSERKFYAHTAENGEWEPLEEHLLSTAKTARSLALLPFADMAFDAGLWHDVGKASHEFQSYLCGKSGRVEHAVCGAQQINRRKHLCKDMWAATALMYVISGHHAGLPDYGTRTDNEDMPTLTAKLKRMCPDCGEYADGLIDLTKTCSAYTEFLQDGLTADGESVSRLREKFVFSVRYLFSLLTDADFLETEAFCLGRRAESKCDFAAAEEKLVKKLAEFKADTQVKKARSDLQSSALAAVDASSEIFSLDMPTGSGKTLTGLRLALRLLRERGLKRIIYIIPYTSILDQTYEVFKEFFADDEILVCHSNFDFDEYANGVNKSETDYGERSAVDKMKKSAENFDAPIVLTTNVRFFESIYSNRSSRLRKLHNLTESVLVFDEIHTLPIKYFQPCFSAIEQLTENYKSTAIFMTATMPDFADLCERYVRRRMGITLLIKDKRGFSAFHNCGFEYLGECDDERIAILAAQNKSALIIVNSRKKAVELYNAAVGNKVHLSTSMTPNDRAAAFKKIRAALDNGEQITVVSTSLIEAGVDLDFDTVYRELAGLDNILQSAGRCNREGKKSNCTTYIFECDGAGSSELEAKMSITRRLIDKYGAGGLRADECIKEYYDEIYKFSISHGGVKNYMTDAKDFIGDKPYKYNFATYADKFKLIEDASYGVIIPDADIKEELEKLSRVGHADRRKLRKFTASATYSTAKDLMECGALERLGEYLILRMPEYYSEDVGLTADAFELKII